MTVMVAPETQLDSKSASVTKAVASSAGWPGRFIGTACRNS
jgi:hypothetical protein